MSANDATLSNAVAAAHPPPQIPMSAMELCTYFPLQLRYPELKFRLIRNGWNNGQIAKAELIARGAYNQPTFTRRANALRQAVGTAGQEKFNDPQFSVHTYRNDPALQPFTDQGSPAANRALYDISRANPPVLPPASIHAPLPAATLEQVAYGVLVHPTGEDAGIFTKAMLWALYYGVAGQYTTDDIMHIVNNVNNFEVPRPGDPAGLPRRRLNVLPGEAGTHRWDQGGRDRVQAIERPW
ncbi:unnamed protein product [Zymoseptoria tritici ST99CH_3D7]|uniref:Uncharacterized protein n=1 Tax=Zymoseptoria tritici (strain ST99CH_3D7) TaxID=1276538 RepID=A0A1X7RZJ3_ZYMT9|nr:unnamed protein product [Zymoseptoria tritici ST99CH_3D7]